MDEERIDPRHERLIALLYGELSQAEEEAVRLEIARDDALRREFEELAGTRAMLQKWEAADRSPSFVFVDDRPSPEASLPGKGWGMRVRRARSRAPWAVAALAAAVAVLAVADFQVDPVDGGLALRFGSGPRPERTGRLAEPSTAPMTLPVGGAPATTSGPLEIPTADLALIPGVGPFVTREEFQMFASDMTRTLVGLLNDYGRDRDGEVAAIMQAAFVEFARKQSSDYTDLRSRIEAMGYRFGEEQLKTSVQMDYLMHEAGVGRLTPSTETRSIDEEGEEK